MGDDTELVARVDAVWKELMALKSSQNMGRQGLDGLGASGVYSGQDTSQDAAWSNTTFSLRVIFTPTETISFAPMANMAYMVRESYIYHSEPVTGVFWSPARIESSTPGRVSWVIDSCYDVPYEWREARTCGRNINMPIQVFSLIRGSVAFERII